MLSHWSLNSVSKMSSNKKLCKRSPTEVRQSFNERICDDLCEVILQYLSLEDKFKLECVSQQFQRTIFQKHYELKTPNNRYERIARILYKNDCYDLKSLESLLKKCPKIRSIELIDSLFTVRGWTCNNYNQLIILINKYCNNLVEFKCPLTQISEQTFSEFHTKFGTNLKVFKRIEMNKELGFMTNFPNLEELELELDYETYPLLALDLFDVRLNRLKTLRVHSFGVEEFFLKDVMNNFNTVRHLELYFDRIFNWDKQVVKSIANLNQLIHLQLKNISQNRRLYCDSLKQIAENCPQLKSIDCGFYHKSGKISNFAQILSPLKAFTHLKRLGLGFKRFPSHTFSGYFDNPGDEGEDNGGMLSFEAFNGFSKLTHLSLQFHSNNQSIDETFLKDIDINLPNLQYLRLPSSFNVTREGTTKMADILSRLSKLESIELKVKDEKTSRQLRKELKDKQKKIRTIILRIYPWI